LLVTTDWQQAADATTLLKALVEEVPTLLGSPLFLVAESYGGKYAATLGASVARAVRAGELNITLGGKTIPISTPSTDQRPQALVSSIVCCALTTSTCLLWQVSRSGIAGSRRRISR
jgi:carboxypeptidase C (cathepsin A)